MHLVQLSAFSVFALQLEEEKNIFDQSYIHVDIHRALEAISQKSC